MYNKKYYYLDLNSKFETKMLSMIVKLISYIHLNECLIKI